MMFPIKFEFQWVLGGAAGTDGKLLLLEISVSYLTLTYISVMWKRKLYPQR